MPYIYSVEIPASCLGSVATWRLAAPAHFLWKRLLVVHTGADAKRIRNFVFIVNIGNAIGAVDDSIGHLWSYRLYLFVWTVGQLVAPDLAGLGALRIITGLGIRVPIVTGPMSIVKIAPMEVSGLFASWFIVPMRFAWSRLSSASTAFTSTSLPPDCSIRWFYSLCVFTALCSTASLFAAIT
ncbi:hypothetical protein GGR53DRAFT_471207 [Hypoxylon sp. FL1150]|nr:hypothetical protein GGR53DRAFT_471207 [Hypoxylon sp. FL1150]